MIHVRSVNKIYGVYGLEAREVEAVEPHGQCEQRCHPGGNPGPNRKSISHRCFLRKVAFNWESTKETIH